MPHYTDYLTLTGLEIYKQDTVVKFKGNRKPKDAPSTRTTITQLSEKSRRRLAFTASNANADFSTMLTITYPKVYPRSGKEVKRHLNAFLTDLRRIFPKVKYLWFLEFQKRGAPHFHILIDYHLIELEPCRIWASQAWARIVNSGDEKHVLAGINWRHVRDKDGAARYAIKYSMKPHQKWVPKDYQDVGRFWGTSRGVKPVPVAVYTVERDQQRQVKSLYDGWEYQNKIDDSVSVRFNSAEIVMQNIDKTGKKL